MSVLWLVVMTIAFAIVQAMVFGHFNFKKLTYTRSFDTLRWPQERPDPLRVARGPLRIPLPSMPGPKTSCGVGAGT